MLPAGVQMVFSSIWQSFGLSYNSSLRQTWQEILGARGWSSHYDVIWWHHSDSGLNSDPAEPAPPDGFTAPDWKKNSLIKVFSIRVLCPSGLILRCGHSGSSVLPLFHFTQCSFPEPQSRFHNIVAKSGNVKLGQSWPCPWVISVPAGRGLQLNFYSTVTIHPKVRAFMPAEIPNSVQSINWHVSDSCICCPLNALHASDRCTCFPMNAVCTTTWCRC